MTERAVRPYEPARPRPTPPQPIGPAAQLDEAIAGGRTAPSSNRPRVDRPAWPEGFLMTFILSAEDDKLSRRREAMDGVTVELKDTDDDPCADFDLLFGKNRFAKAREVSPNQSVTFSGASGRRFRLIVLAVNDDSETVRFGIAPD
jgi:hypothetical protein